ncbi:MAG: DUF1080 domain-containing protein [Saprospiraceae bacterium]
MNKLKAFLLISIFVQAACNNSTIKIAKAKVTLFNSLDLSNWDVYIGPGLDADGKHRADVPALGLNPGEQNTFTVVDSDGAKAIRISGERFGGISTREEYKNYHFQCKFKWGTLKWVPKEKSKMDSGILYHAVGPHGVDGGFWMRSQEFQVQEHDCGDYWGLDRASFDIVATRQSNGDYKYDPFGKKMTFNVDNAIGRHCVRSTDYDKPTGEWNTLDLYCVGGTAVHMINGKVNMVLTNSRHIKDGVETPLTKGKIQIQSEGAEIFYKDLTIQSIHEIPSNVLKN